MAEKLVKVEILKKFKHSDPETNVFYQGIPGEVWFVGEEFATYGCKMGWFRDLADVIPTGKPDKSEVVLAPNKSIYGAKSEKVNG